jgi:ribosomal RNA assembly protein
LHDVKARIIGTEGKTKRTIESLGECYIIVKDSIVYLLAPADKVEYITTAITNLIKGSKQSNVYKFLEERNAQEKINLNEDLGIKNKD